MIICLYTFRAVAPKMGGTVNHLSSRWVFKWCNNEIVIHVFTAGRSIFMISSSGSGKNVAWMSRVQQLKYDDHLWTGFQNTDRVVQPMNELQHTFMGLV